VIKFGTSYAMLNSHQRVLYVNTPANGTFSISVDATTLPRTGEAREDNPYSGQIPNVEEIQQLYDKSENKSGTVTAVEVIE
jgi:hypothetical protein